MSTEAGNTNSADPMRSQNYHAIRLAKLRQICLIGAVRSAWETLRGRRRELANSARPADAHQSLVWIRHCKLVRPAAQLPARFSQEFRPRICWPTRPQYKNTDQKVSARDEP